MIKRHYYIACTRYRKEDGAFCGYSYKVVTHKAWFADPKAVLEVTKAGWEEELPDQQIHITHLNKV